MNTRVQSALLGMLILLTVFSYAACSVDYLTIRSIVDETNSANVGEALLNEIDQLESWDKASVGTKPELDKSELIELAEQRNRVIERINEYITKHPEQKVIINALRIRKAMLYLISRQFNSARTSFSEIDPDALRSDRDRAFHQAHEVLIWWTKVGPAQDPLPSNESFQENIDQLTKSLLP